METATQETEQGSVCGPIRLEIEDFKPILSEIVFVSMEPDQGEYEPLIGYIPLEQAGILVDMLGHRLKAARYLDLK